jgi:hypothetical protein
LRRAASEDFSVAALISVSLLEFQTLSSSPYLSRHGRYVGRYLRSLPRSMEGRGVEWSVKVYILDNFDQP